MVLLSDFEDFIKIKYLKQFRPFSKSFLVNTNIWRYNWVFPWILLSLKIMSSLFFHKRKISMEATRTMITNRSTLERIQMLSQPRKSLSGKNRSYYIPELIVYSWLNLTNCKRWSLFFCKRGFSFHDNCISLGNVFCSSSTIQKLRYVYSYTQTLITQLPNSWTTV